MADQQQPTISETGVWVDTDTGRVVEAEPESGRLIVPPGGEVDQRVVDEIAAAKLAAGQTDDDQAEVDDAADEAEVDEKPRRGRGRAKDTATVADDTDKATEA